MYLKTQLCTAILNLRLFELNNSKFVNSMLVLVFHDLEFFGFDFQKNNLLFESVLEGRKDFFLNADLVGYCRCFY